MNGLEFGGIILGVNAFTYLWWKVDKERQEKRMRDLYEKYDLGEYKPCRWR